MAKSAEVKARIIQYLAGKQPNTRVASRNSMCRQFSASRSTIDKVMKELEDEENPDIFLVEDNKADLDEILITAFVLDMDTKFLCSEDCPGLCHQCGKPLRDGPCDCKKDIDPRLAVLGQLLNDN